MTYRLTWRHRHLARPADFPRLSRNCGGLALLRWPYATAAQRRGTAAALAEHKVAIHVDQNDKAVMELALNKAKNIIEHYPSRGESVAVEIVTYAPACICCARIPAR
jgi:hypothetical protein